MKYLDSKINALFLNRCISLFFILRRTKFNQIDGLFKKIEMLALLRIYGITYFIVFAVPI